MTTGSPSSGKSRGSLSASGGASWSTVWPLVVMAIVGAAVWFTYKRVEASWQTRVGSELAGVVARDVAVSVGKVKG